MHDYKRLAMKASACTLNMLGGLPFAPFYRGMGHILMFHRVQNSIAENRIWANSYLEVTTDYLETTVQYFKRHDYVFLSMDDLPAYLARKGRKRSFVVYTFDDGFRDNLEIAYPVLSRLGVPMTVYVTTGFPDHTALLWWNDLERLLLAHEKIDLTLGDGVHRLDLSGKARKHEAFRQIAWHIKHDSHGTLKGRVKALLEPFDIDPLDEVRRNALSWDDLRWFAGQPGVTIGAHTVTHPVLAELAAKDAAQEIAKGKDLLEQAIGQGVRHFAYPFGGPGEILQRDADAAQALGFETAVTTYSSNVHTGHKAYPMLLPRIAVGMSMGTDTFDLIRHGVIPMIRSRGKRLVAIRQEPHP